MLAGLCLSSLGAAAERAPVRFDHLEFPPFSLQGGRRKAAELFGGETPLSGVLANLSQSVYGAPLQ